MATEAQEPQTNGAALVGRNGGSPGAEQTQSENLAELAVALVKAQAVIEGAKKDSSNPFFNSTYADLASVWDVCRKPLTDNGLAVVQTTAPTANGVTLVTTLLHVSGQWIRGTLHMTPVKNDPQGVGSCITYARRYALAAIVGVVQVDDDGEGAAGRAVPPAREPAKAKPAAKPTNGHEEPPHPADDTPTSETHAGDETPARFAYLMAELKGCEESMNDWERSFFADTYKRFKQYGDRSKVSPKQFTALENVYDNVAAGRSQRESDDIPF